MGRRRLPLHAAPIVQGRRELWCHPLALIFREPRTAQPRAPSIATPDGIAVVIAPRLQFVIHYWSTLCRAHRPSPPGRHHSCVGPVHVASQGQWDIAHPIGSHPQLAARYWSALCLGRQPSSHRPDPDHLGSSRVGFASEGFRAFRSGLPQSALAIPGRGPEPGPDPSHRIPGRTIMAGPGAPSALVFSRIPAGIGLAVRRRLEMPHFAQRSRVHMRPAAQRRTQLSTDLGNAPRVEDSSYWAGLAEPGAGANAASAGARAAAMAIPERSVPPVALDHRSIAAAAEPTPTALIRPPAPRQAPAIDLDAISRDVISRIERRLRIERERHGRL
jgi:hypothetical protein